MPVHYRIVKPMELVMSHAEGAVTFDDLRAHQQAIVADPNFHPDMRQLFDFSSLATFAPKADEMRQFAESRCNFARTARRAVVAPRDVFFGIARMYQSWLGDEAEGLEIFRTLRGAASWLDIGLDTLSEIAVCHSEIGVDQKSPIFPNPTPRPHARWLIPLHQL